MKIQLCICSSGKPFIRCCLPLLEGAKFAKTPQALMRSRFSAFALGGYGEYLLDTWLPSSSAGMDVVELSQRSVNWVRLDVVDKSQKGEIASVEFKAYFLDQRGEEQVHHEVSAFQRLSGRWFYVSGDVFD